MKPIRPAARSTVRTGVALLAASALLLAACGDDDDRDGDAATGGGGDPAAQVEVSDAWARTSPRVADAGAVYMHIANGGDADDALVGVEVDGTVAGRAELHETVAAADDDAMDDDAMDDDGMDDDGGMGMMEMRPVDRIEIPAGGSVDLEPGGHHIMLLELAAPLDAGSSIELTLEFEESGEQVVTADVRDEAP